MVKPVTPLSKLVDHIWTLRPEDNGTGVITEAEFERLLIKAGAHVIYVPRETPK